MAAFLAFLGTPLGKALTKVAGVLMLMLLCFFGGCACARGADPVYGECWFVGVTPGTIVVDPGQAVRVASAADPVKASVRIDCPQGGGVTHHGSGTVVAVEDGKALIVTNRHVCPADGEILVRWPDGKSGYADWLGADDKADLAVLMTLAPDGCEACPPAAAPAMEGTQLVQVGYPRTKGPIRRVGAALGWDGSRLMSGARVGHANLQTDQGDSGSGVFVDGKLVAVVWGRKGDQCACVAYEDVRRFLLRDRVRKLFPRMTAVLVETPEPPLAVEPVHARGAVIRPVAAPVFGGNCPNGNCPRR